MKVKNGLLLTFIYFITICFVIYLSLIYKNSSSNINNSSIYNYVIDVTSRRYEDLYNNVINYNDEVSDYVIYAVSYNKSSINSFESMLESLIVSNGLNDKILYINVDNLKKIDYINRLVGDLSFDYSIKIDDLPLFVCIHHGNVVKVVSVSDFDYDSLSDFLEDVYD